MKLMPTGGQSGRLRQPQKGDAVGLTLGPKYCLRNPKSSTGFSFRQRGALHSLLVPIRSMTVMTSNGLLLFANDKPEIFLIESAALKYLS